VRRLLTTLTCLFVAAAGTTLAVPAQAAEPLPVTYNFLLSAVTAGVKVDADPPGSNIWTCKPSARHPRPVVLVHGTAGNKNTNWQTYAPLLKNNGYCVYSFTYGVAPGTPLPLSQLGGFTRIQDSAKQLAAFISRVRKSTGAAKVDLVGHSQGTLMPNYYVKFMDGARFVKRYVSLAPLWHGTSVGAPIGQLAAVFGFDAEAAPVCAACSQMSNGSAFIKKMRTGPVAVEGVVYTNIMTKYDELVSPYTSGIEKGMRNVVVQNKCATDYAEHFEIAADPVASVVVLNALDPAHPRPVPCVVVLPFVGPLG
jgi:triacylglycerol lipase